MTGITLPVILRRVMLTRKQLDELRRTAPHGKNRLSAARKLAGITQVELAEAWDVTQGYISRLERSAYEDLPLEMSRRAAEFFGCHIEDLFPARQAVA